MFASFIPLVIVSLVYAGFVYPIARRKGFGIGHVALCAVPVLGQFTLLWIVSKTDKDILDRLEKLEG